MTGIFFTETNTVLFQQNNLFVSGEITIEGDVSTFFDHELEVDTGDLFITPGSADIQFTLVITVPTASIDITTFAPTVLAKTVIIPPGNEIDINTFAPTVSLS